MDPKREREIKSQARQYLLQIALELEAAAAGARGAAEAIDNRDLAMPHVQQLYSRFNEAILMLDRFKRTIDEGLANNK